jgi:hypothetical protein
MVEAIMLERNKGRLGLRVQELGNKEAEKGPATKLRDMGYEDMQGFFINTLKSHKVIQRLEAYKDDRLLDDVFFDERVTAEHLNLSPNVYGQLIYLSDKLALELSKESVAGIDVNAEGELWLYHWKAPANKSLSDSLKGGRGKKTAAKKKEEDKPAEELPVKPVVRIHYLID